MCVMCGFISNNNVKAASLKNEINCFLFAQLPCRRALQVQSLSVVEFSLESFHKRMYLL